MNANSFEGWNVYEIRTSLVLVYSNLTAKCNIVQLIVFNNGIS